MMRVRLFAALADAAGARDVEVEAATVPDLLAELADGNDLMAARLRTATVYVDREPVASDDRGVDLSDAAEVVVVPPFAGG